MKKDYKEIFLIDNNINSYLLGITMLSFVDLDSSVSGYIILAMHNAAGADITEAIIR